MAASREAGAKWLNMEAIASATKQKVETVARTSVLVLFSRIVMRSPVDTGRFRANWLPSYGSPSASASGDTDRGGAKTLRAIESAVLSYQIGGTFFLCNSLPYAHVLEWGLYPDPPKLGSKKRGEAAPRIHVVGGYSEQAPQGMVRKSVEEFLAAARGSAQ